MTRLTSLVSSLSVLQMKNSFLHMPVDKIVNASNLFAALKESLQSNELDFNECLSRELHFPSIAADLILLVRMVWKQFLFT